jgi:hypothetical protein
MSIYYALWRRFDERTRLILELRAEGFTLTEIAEECRVSPERVRQLERSAHMQLRSDIDLAIPGLRQEIRELEGDLQFIRAAAVARLIGEPPEGSVSVLLLALGYRRCKVWGETAFGLYESAPGRLQQLFAAIAEQAPFKDEELEDRLSEQSIPLNRSVLSVLGSPRSPLLRDKNNAWIRRGSKNRDSAYLWLRDEAEPRTIEEICTGIGAASTHALAELFRRNSDTFLQVRPEGTWALTDWNAVSVMVEYRDATAAVVDVLRDRGPLSRRQLTAEVIRRYPVSASRVSQCFASFQIGTTKGGMFDLTERGALLVLPKEPKKPVHVVRIGPLIAVKMRVSRDVLRGSGLGISPWVTWSLGLHHYPDRMDFGGAFPVTVRRQSSGSAISTLRDSAVALGLKLNCTLLVILDVVDRCVTIRHGCDGDCTITEDGSARPRDIQPALVPARNGDLLSSL